MRKPLAIDLFCGLGGWTEGLLAEDYDVVGFDIERHAYGDHAYPAQLVIQDVLTLHGSQFRDAELIVASPPCQEYSYMAMPWSLAKAKAKAIREDTTGAALADLNRLFDACFRIQIQASLAAGRHIPMVVENVRGASPWVGRARWNFGSFYLWGDVPALMPATSAIKNSGGSWFVPPPGRKCAAKNNPDGRKIGGGAKVPGIGWTGFADTGSSWRNREHVGIKADKDDGVSYGGSFGWDGSPLPRGNSKSSARKRASAMIAKIPLPLSRHIAAVYREPT